MKTFLILVTLWFMQFITVSVFAQATFTTPYSLQVTTNKTTHVVFPFAIKSIDRGTQDVLVQKAPGAENVLQLKAAKEGFAPTNVTVITEDEKLYPFMVSYDSLPQHLTVSLINTEDPVYNGYTANLKALANVDHHTNIESLQNTANLVARGKTNMFVLADTKGNVFLHLKGLYIQNDVYYFQIQVSNSSSISYKADHVSFTIKDKKKFKRTANQEADLTPGYASGVTTAIDAHEDATWVVALPKFTLEDGKYLLLSVMEKDGGRYLFLKLKNRHLLRSRSIVQR